MAAPISSGTIQPLPLTTPLAPDERAGDGAAARPGESAPRHLPSPPHRPGSYQPAVVRELPSAPPPSTDPEIWSLLTMDERAYFSSLQPATPVTYRPSQGSEATVRAGMRVDVRV